MSVIRTCFVFTSYYPTYSGGAIYIRRFMPYLRRVEIDAFVLTSQVSGRSQREVIDGAEVRRIPSVGNFRGKLGRLMFSLSLAVQLWMYRDEYDLVHFGDGIGGGYVAIPLLKLIGKPVVVESILMGSDDGLAVRQQKFGLVKLAILKRADFIWGLSDAIYASFIQCGFNENKVKVLPYGIDCTDYRPSTEAEKWRLRTELGLPINGKLAVFAGGINRRKGIDFLIRSFSKVVPQIPDAYLILVGPQYKEKKDYIGYYDEVNNLVQKLNLTSHVIFTGEVPTILDYLQSADIYVTASHQEGLGLAVLEAMACGLPCVCTHIPGVTDMIFEDGTGFILPQRDEDAYAQKIMELFRSPAQATCIGGAARSRVEKHFEIRNRAKIFRKLYTLLTPKKAEHKY